MEITQYFLWIISERSINPKNQSIQTNSISSPLQQRQSSMGEIWGSYLALLITHYKFTFLSLLNPGYNFLFFKLYKWYRLFAHCSVYRILNCIVTVQSKREFRNASRLCSKHMICVLNILYKLFRSYICSVLFILWNVCMTT